MALRVACVLPLARAPDMPGGSIPTQKTAKLLLVFRQPLSLCKAERRVSAKSGNSTARIGFPRAAVLGAHPRPVANPQGIRDDALIMVGGPTLAEGADEQASGSMARNPNQRPDIDEQPN